MQRQTVGDVLQLIRCLSMKLKEQRTKMEQLQEVEASDGLRAVGYGTTSKVGYRRSQIEGRLVLKERLEECFQEATASEAELVSRMTGILESIKLRIRKQEFELLKDVFIDQLPVEEMKDIHGARWQSKFGAIEKTYGR